MSQLTKNFWRHEMGCKCGCGFDTVDFKTLEAVQKACDHFAREQNIPRVICNVNSAARCATHNAAVGGAATSQHVRGRAMDIRIVGVTPKLLYDYLCEKYPDRYGFGIYGGFVHVDTRTGQPARW